MRVPCLLLSSLPPGVLVYPCQFLEEEDSPGAVDHCDQSAADLNLREVLVPGQGPESPLAQPGESQALAHVVCEKVLRQVRVPRQLGRGHLAPGVLVTPGPQGPQAWPGGRQGGVELT